jgi:hypothetical protein
MSHCADDSVRRLDRVAAAVLIASNISRAVVDPTGELLALSGGDAAGWSRLTVGTATPEAVSDDDTNVAACRLMPIRRSGRGDADNDITACVV